MDQVVYSFLGLSLLANGYFAYTTFIKKRPLTTGATELLNELNRGGRAVLDVRVMDAAGLFWRSPKG